MRGFGTKLALLAGLSFAINNVITKLAYASDVSVLYFMTIRTCLAAVLLWALAFGRRKPTVSRRTFLVIAVLGAVGYAGQSLLFSEAIKRTSVSTTVMGLYIFPVVVAALSVGFLHERLNPSILLALFFGSVGVVLAIGIPHQSIEIDGALLALLSGVTYGVLILFIGRASSLAPPMQFAAIVLLGMSVSLLVLLLVSGNPGAPTEAQAWLWILLSSVAVAGGIAAFAASVASLGPTRASIGNTVEPPATAVLAALVLAESISARLVIGIVFVVIAVVLLRNDNARQDRAALEPASDGRRP